MTKRDVGGARKHTEGSSSARAVPSAADVPVTVRAASPQDLATVVSLRLDLLREHSANPIYGRLRPDAREHAERLFAGQLASAGEVTLLAHRAGTCVGILRCIHAPGSPLLYPSHYGYVSSVYVVPKARRGGVLRALLAAAEQWCESRGLTEIRLHNVPEAEASAAAWQALGFEIVEHLRVRHLPARS